MSMTPQEREIADRVLRALQSEKYKNKNYLFLQPFDISQVPGYLDVVKKPLDLQTVQNNLLSNVYDSSASFWQDMADVFENAIKYHSGKETKWIAKFAKDMLKALGKERKIAEKKIAGPSAPKLTLKIAKSAPANQESPGKQLPVGALSAPDVVNSASPPKTKPSIKLKLPSQAKQGQKDLPVKAKPLKLKLSLSKKSTMAATKPGAASTPTTADTTAPAPAEETHIRPVIATSTAAVVSSMDPPPSKQKSPKISVKMGNSRGKELPKAVAAKQQQQQTSSSKAPKIKVKKTTTTKNSAANAMSPDRLRQCAKVLAGLRRREQKHVHWFLQPVSDKAILQDYKSKIKHPMDISTVSAKLRRGSYKKVSDFCLDIRRIFANCLRYNTSIKDSLRPIAVNVLETAEKLLKVFIAQPEAPQPSPYPPLLYCWRLCMEIIDTLYNLVNPTDGQPTAYFFLHPVSFYCGGEFPPDYLEKVPKPMDFGTVTANLIEGRYQAVDQFSSDCMLVLSNCHAYYNGREDGRMYEEHANVLREYLSKQLEQLSRYTSSPKGASDRAKAEQPIILPRPTPELFLSVIEDLRALKYTDKATKITENAMGPFEKPIPLDIYPDYIEHIKEPMYLQMIEQKTRATVYSTPEDFEYDVNLIFQNCETYHSKRNGDHLVAMAKNGARQFRRIYYAKVRSFEDPSSVPPPKPERQESAAPPAAVSTTAPPAKKIRIDTSSLIKGKTTPRISLPISQAPPVPNAQSRSKSPRPPSTTSQKKITTSQPKTNQPVPLHIAIARVKEAFPLRRALKSLQNWEADSARYLKELMRHPWISAARPKFIFHVPVPDLFPELKDAYAAKIPKPMDLTTIECTLLAGNRYASPEDIVQDVALVFANAVRFNKDGRDIGDPLSCAYYDASVHLLKYSRWLSLELLSAYVDDSDMTDEPGPDGLPPFSWKLSTGNKNRARKEMEELVLNEPVDKSLEGDRWTWHEAECEKLLKSLRHQSDLRYMTFFIQPNYPPDYTTFIAKPMDWEKVQRTLKKRQYDKFGDIIEDLRLIFSNALKYNARLKGTDTVSGRAYDSAVYMSGKLEAAINKVLLTVSDRIERERIDHANAEREIEAEERAEEARIRAAWKKEPDKDGVSPATRNDPSQKIRFVRARRREADFEIPYFEETDDGSHHEQYSEGVKLQKALFEKQRQELARMRQLSFMVGSTVFARMHQRDMAAEWAAEEAHKVMNTSHPNVAGPESAEREDIESQPSVMGSSVLNELEREGRSRMKIKLGSRLKAPIRHRKRPALNLDFDASV